MLLLIKSSYFFEKSRKILSSFPYWARCNCVMLTYLFLSNILCIFFSGGKPCGLCEKPWKTRGFSRFRPCFFPSAFHSIRISTHFAARLCLLPSKQLCKLYKYSGPPEPGSGGLSESFRYPSIRMVRFSGSLGAVFLGTFSFRTPSSKRALISSSVTPVPT